jgi:hypothetical protein
MAINGHDLNGHDLIAIVVMLTAAGQIVFTNQHRDSRPAGMASRLDC